MKKPCFQLFRELEERKALKSHFWQAQPHLSLEFLETIRVVKRDTKCSKKLSLFHCQDSIELGKNAYLPEVSFRT